MKNLNLKPEKVWQFFFKICNIPHPSGYEGKFRDYIKEFAKDRALELHEDKVGNILIKRVNNPQSETVILQSHLDMVPQKTENSEHDFINDPLNITFDGQYISADDTTLGADNGIGVAITLAVIDEPNPDLPNINALFTIEEETGMKGAFELNSKFLDGKYLINLDSEDASEIYIGCAGGITTSIKFPLQEVTTENKKHYKLNISGFKGGHSGIDINKPIGNPIIIIFELLDKIYNKFNFSLSNINAGDLVNAIPRSAEATISIDNSLVDSFEEYKEHLITETLSTYKHYTNSLSLNIINTDDIKSCYSIDASLFQKLKEIPNGIIESGTDTIIASSNLGICNIKNNEFAILTLQRSFIKEKLQSTVQLIKNSLIGEIENIAIKSYDEYPGWQPIETSELINLATEIYERKYSNKAKKIIIHAGLECGVLKSKNNKLDIISIGPNIFNPHSPREKVEVSSVQKSYEYLLELLKEIKS